MKTRNMLAMLMIVALVAAAAMAQDKPVQPKPGAEPQGKEVTMTGQLMCSACALSAEGARMDCKEHGCLMTLKTADGKFISFLPNKYSDPLLKGTMVGKTMTITGKYFAGANLLDVESFQVEGGKPMTWCEHCQAMDACAAK
jgi:hypothetical protein